MGLRSPQEMKRTPLQAEGSTRFQGGTAPQLDTRFIGTIAKTIEEDKDAAVAAKKKMLEFQVAQADNEAENDIIKAQAELTDSEGLDSIKVKEQKANDLRKTFDARLGKVQNEEFKPYIQMMMEKKLTKYQRFATPYAAGQAKKAELDTFKTYTANAMNDAINGSGDLGYLSGEGLGNVTQAIAAASKRQGLSKEQTEFNIASGTSQTILKSIEQQAKMPGALPKAEAILSMHDPLMLPGDRIKALKALKAAKEDSESREALSISEMAHAQSGGNPEKTDELIRQMSLTSNIAKQAYALSNYRYTAEKRQKTKNTEDAKVAVFKAVDAEMPASQIMDLARKIEDPIERNKVVESIAKNGGRPPIVSSRAVRDMLNERFAREPEYAKSINLDAYSRDLSYEDIETLRLKQERYFAADNKKVDLAQSGKDAEKDRKVNVWLNSKGIFDPQERNEFKWKADRRYEQLLKENPRANQREINGALYSELDTKGMKTQGAGGFWHTVTLGLVDENMEDVPNENFDKVPDGYIDPSHIAAIKKADPTITNSQMTRTLKNLAHEGRDLSKPYTKTN